MTSGVAESSQTLESYLATRPEFASVPRIQSLYSDLGRQKLSNPSGYAANLGWWRTTLQEIVRRRLQPDQNDALILHASQELSDALRWDKVGRPAGLSTIVEDLVHDGVLHPLEPFLSSSASIYEGGSLVGRVADVLIKRSFWWALEHLNLVSSEATESAAAKWKRVAGDYVVVSVLKNLADNIIATQDEKSALTLSESIHNVDSFKRYAESCSISMGGLAPLSSTDIKVLLRHLSRDRQVLVIQGDMIKFAEDAVSQEITTVDRGVFELKSTIERVEQQIHHIEISIASRTAQIKAALLANRKEIAKLQLGSRKALEALLNQRVSTMTTLTAAMSSIDQAHGDAAILRAYESGSKVLKEIMGRPEMQKERVDEVMDQLREGVEGAEEMRRLVEEAGWEVVHASGTAVDDDELLKELEEIQREETAPTRGQTTSPRHELDEKPIRELTQQFEAQRVSSTPGSEKLAQLA